MTGEEGGCGGEKPPREAAKAAARAPSVSPRQEAEAKISEGYTADGGYIRGTGLVCRLPRQGQVLGCEGCMPMGAGRDRKFCTQGTPP